MTDVDPPPRAKTRRSSARWRLLLLVAGIGALVLVGLCALGGTFWAESKVRDKLDQLATGAGLTLKVADVSVSPLGVVGIEDLHLVRPTGGDVIAFGRAEAAISPLRALAGSRRPEILEVEDLRLDVRVVDGRPAELLDLLASARKLVRRKKGAEPRDVTARKKGPVLIVRGGEAQLQLAGQGAELLPKGLRTHGLQVHLDPDRGIGKLEALVEGSVQSKLHAKVVPAAGDRPARVEARFQPEFRIGLPLKGRAGKLIDALVVGGFGFDTLAGPSVDGLALRRGKAPILQIAHVRPADDGFGVRAQKVAFQLPGKWLLEALPDDRLAAVLGKEDLAGTLGALAVDLVNPLSGSMALTVKDGRLPLPGKRGALTVNKVALHTARSPGADPLRAIESLEVHGPELMLTWREGSLATLPGGEVLYKLVEGARWGNAAEADADKEAKVEEEAKGKKRKKRKRRRRRRKPRKPAIHGAIAPIARLLAQTLKMESSLQDATTALARWPALKVKVHGGRFGLVEPAAEGPFGGLGDLSIDLTPRLGDGGRGLLLSARPFASDGKWEAATLDLRGAAGDRLERVTWTLGGPRWAGALAAAVGPIVAGDGAELRLKGELKLAKEAPGPVVLTDVTIRKLGLEWWRIAPRPINDLDIDLKLRLSADRKAGGLDLQATEIKLGEASFTLGLTLTDIRSDDIAGHLQLAMPKQDCAKAAAALPASVLPTIGSITAEGEIAWTFDLRVPLRKPYKGKLEASLDDEACQVLTFGNVDIAELAGDFKRPVNESGTILEDQLIGPKSESWVPLDDLPPWVPYAMMATEDAAFFHHRGLRLGLLSRAIKMCMDYGRFVYGGSTITQQLVKNLFLTRDKYLMRKFEELLIVWHMERNLMAKAKLEDDEDPTRATKDRIMELYINGIEFGPQLYGVVRAAEAYFAKPAAELTPLESAFLAANKPCPKCGHKRFTTQKWTPWWQERMVGIMKRMRKDGIISDEQFIAEAPYVPRFVGWPQTEAETSEPDVGGVEE